MIKQRLRKYTILGFSALCLVLSCRSFYFAVTDAKDVFKHLILGVLVLGLSYVIYQQFRWALRLVAGLFLLIVIILPIGIFNPFTAGDRMAVGKEVPSVAQTLLWLIPLEALLLGIVFLVDPNKKISAEKP